MRPLYKFSLVLALLAFCASGHAQTKPKTSAKKTTTAKKAPVKKKTAAAEINVYVCTSSKDKFYHKRSSCAGLNKCSEEIKNIKSQGMLNKYKKAKCKRCFT
jgi:hypothetical protein